MFVSNRTFFPRRFTPGALLVVALALTGCYAGQARPTNTPTEGKPSEDRIGVDDTFDVRVYGEAELSGNYRVATDGTIDFPLAGRLYVAALRPGDVQLLLVKKLKDGSFL